MVHVVHVNAHRRVEREVVVTGAHAAQGDGGRRALGRDSGTRVEVRHSGAERRDVREVADLEIVRRDRRDGEWRRLHVFLRVARGDD